MSSTSRARTFQTVLRSLAEFSGKNIVASKEVKGEVTLRLRNVPCGTRWTSCSSRRAWAWSRTGQTIVISNLDTLRKEELERNSAARNQEELLPLETRSSPSTTRTARKWPSRSIRTLTKRGHIEVDDRPTRSS